MKMCIKYVLMFFAFQTLSVFALSSDPDISFNRYYARVKNKNANVRARPSTSAEIVMEVAKGQDLLVIGQSGEWIKIYPGDKVFAWIHKDMIDNGVVSKNNVNVRLGSSVSSSELGKLSEGDPVIEIKREGDWVQIEMPRGFGFWIASFLVKFLCPEYSYQEYVIKEKMAVQAFDEAEKLRKDEFIKKFDEIDHDKVVAAYQAIIDKYPDTNEALKAHERVIDAREKKAMAKQKSINVSEFKRLLQLFDEAEGLKQKFVSSDEFSETELKDIVGKYEYIKENYPNTKEAKLSQSRLDELEKFKSDHKIKVDSYGVFSGTGKLKEGKSAFYGKAAYILASGSFSKEKQCYVYSEKIDLRAYVKKKVTLKGKIVDKSKEEMDIPLVEIEEISLLK
ncbi:MAG: hypothetical protein ACD_79C01234G0004 [uncultured bacterium]|nr:MAG: hypothetical protein ACD_79C01234G0004 [uncultured bacterium]